MDPDEEAAIQESGELGINLVNIILLNPDYELETFKNDYYELKNVRDYCILYLQLQYCPKITIYADHRDAAIKVAFKLTNKPSLGNNSKQRT